MQNIDYFLNMLQQEKERLEALVERTSKHLYRRDEPYSADFAEQAVEVENYQVVEQLDEDGKGSLLLIKKALAKIDDGSFGSCETCGEPINEDRLKAVPYTPHCIDCAEIAV